jgi:hypothetical protein
VRRDYMKNLISLISLILLLFITGCSPKSYINNKDSIPDNDEKIIKEFRSHHNYTKDQLKTLEIKHLGDVSDYRIYYVPFKGSSGVLNEEDWIEGEYIFPIESHTRIIGIRNDKLYTLGELINETQIDIKALYNIMPDEYKKASPSK